MDKMDVIAGSYANRPMELPCHCEEQSDEAIQPDHRGALRAPRDDIRVKGQGDWYERLALRVAELGLLARVANRYGEYPFSETSARLG
ncbi:MAG: hypothetical protein WDM96_13325 [Lacunisphaera sp.]